MSSFDQVHIAFKKVSPGPEKTKSGVAPIILLHGITSAKETWEKVMQPIADQTGREVFALDARNHGDSGWSDDFSYDVIDEDVLRFVQKMNLSKFAIIGHSFGGRAAMKFVLNKPNLVEKLVVEDISPKRSVSSTRQSVIEYIQTLNKLIKTIPSHINDLTEAKKFLSNLLCNTELQDDPTRGTENSNGFYLGIRKNEDGKFVWKANLELLEKFLSGNFGPTPEVDCVFENPVLFLFGTKSPYNVGNDEEVIKSLFPNSTLIGIEAGHQIHLGQPQKFVEEVVKFMNS